MEQIPIFLKKSSTYLSYIFAFSMSILFEKLPVLIVVWVINLLFFSIINRKIRFSFNSEHILLMGFYFFYVAGLFWSTDKATALFALEIKLSLLVFPIIIAVNKDFFKEIGLNILLSFVIGIIVSSLFCLGTAVWESVFLLADGFVFKPIDPDFATWEFGGSHFRYLTLSLFMHPTYFSIYILFALVISILLTRKGTYLNENMRIFFIAAIPLFVIMLYLLSSKAVLTNASILFISFFFIKYKSRRGVLSKLSFVLLVMIILGVTFQNPRFASIKNAVNQPGQISDNSRNGSFISRMHIWKTSLAIISDNPLVGVGPGDTKNELVNRYLLFDYKDPLMMKSNAHNQYLETFINLGFFGFVFFIGITNHPIL